MTTLPKDSLLARGRTAEVYAWQDDQVLKLFFDWCPPEWAEREAMVGRRIAATSLPTPKLIDTVQVDGRHGIVYERINGPSILTVMSAKPWLVTRLARSFAELHVQVHRQNGDGLTSVRAALDRSISQTELPSDLKAKALRILDQLPEGETLCHFDFHPDQVLMTEKGFAIIDWITAFQGDPLADIARTLVLFNVGKPLDASWLQSRLIDLFKNHFHQTYLRRYFELSPGIDRAQINAWMIPVAAARLKEEIAGERESLLELIQTLLQKQ